MVDQITKDILFKHNLRFIDTLGQGGFGKVYKVEDTIAGQFLAVKELKQFLKQRQDFILDEIRQIAQLDHPNIISYKNSFRENSNVYLVMEYCSNGSLEDELKNGPMPMDKLVRTFLILTDALDYLHQKGKVHHDIKPANILLKGDENIKISDFGTINRNIGTRVYSPPEKLNPNSPVNDTRIDTYSLGVALMVCALGRHPLVGCSEEEMIRKVKNGEFPIDDLEFWLQQLILKSCHFDPSARFQSMREFKQALINRNIPQILTSDLLNDEDVARKLEMSIRLRRWRKAKYYIEHHKDAGKSINFVIQKGRYYLAMHDLKSSKQCFENALSININAPLEKELAEIYIQTGQAAKAISLLQSYISKNFYDKEAHNQLLHCYFISDRHILGLEQARMVIKVFPDEIIFQNNLVLFELLVNKQFSKSDKFYQDNPFATYNFGNVFSHNKPESWSWSGKPFFKDKLIFQEFQHRKLEKSENTIVIKTHEWEREFSQPIITIGRAGYEYNDICLPYGNSVSRRHCAIINQKNNVWLYDLGSATGIRKDGIKVIHKTFLLGQHSVEIGGKLMEVKSDRGLLL